MLTMTLLTTALYSQAALRIPKNAPQMDTTATRDMLRDAEDQVVDLWTAHNPRLERKERKIGYKPSEYGGDYERRVSNHRDTMLVEHRGNPLVGNVCVFKARFDRTMGAVDAVKKRWSESEFLPTEAASGDFDLRDDQFIAVCSLRGRLQRHFEPDMSDMDAEEDPAIAAVAKIKSLEERLERDKAALSNKMISELTKELKQLRQDEKKLNAKWKKRRNQKLRERKQKISDLRHELRVLLPDGHRPPSRVRGQFDVSAYVNGVEYDNFADYPTMIIHAILLQSEKLGLDAKGKINP